LGCLFYQAAVLLADRSLLHEGLKSLTANLCADVVSRVSDGCRGPRRRLALRRHDHRPVSEGKAAAAPAGNLLFAAVAQVGWLPKRCRCVSEWEAAAARAGGSLFAGATDGGWLTHRQSVKVSEGAAAAARAGGPRRRLA